MGCDGVCVRARTQCMIQTVFGCTCVWGFWRNENFHICIHCTSTIYSQSRTNQINLVFDHFTLLHETGNKINKLAARLCKHKMYVRHAHYRPAWLFMTSDIAVVAVVVVVPFCLRLFSFYIRCNIISIISVAKKAALESFYMWIILFNGSFQGYCLSSIWGYYSFRSM